MTSNIIYNAHVLLCGPEADNMIPEYVLNKEQMAPYAPNLKQAKLPHTALRGRWPVPSKSALVVAFDLSTIPNMPCATLIPELDRICKSGANVFIRVREAFDPANLSKASNGKFMSSRLHLEWNEKKLKELQQSNRLPADPTSKDILNQSKSVPGLVRFVSYNFVKRFSICSRSYVRDRVPEKGHSIPFRLCMTAPVIDNTPIKVFNNIHQYGKNQANERIPFRIYTDNDCRTFLDRHFDKAVVSKFDVLKGAHKADLFRYCYLYINGGLYMDIKTELVMPLVSFLEFGVSNTDLYTSIAVGQYIYQGLLCCKPGLPIFQTLIATILDTDPNLLAVSYFAITQQFHQILQSLARDTIKAGPLPLADGTQVELFQELTATWLPNTD